MYPPRSQRNEGRKRAKKPKIGKAWIITNLVLLLMIVGLFGYYYIFERDSSDSLAENAQYSQTEKNIQTGSANDDEYPTPSGSEEVNETKESTVPDTSSSPVTTPDTNASEGSSSGAKSSSEKDRQAQENSPKKDANNDDANSPAVTLHFIGDVQFSGKVEQRLEQNGFDFPYQYLGSLFHKDDLTIANLETPVTTNGVGALNKTYVYKSSPKALTAMAAAGIDAVNLANNHILDQGTSGLLDTLNYLDEKGIAHAGAGRNAKEAYAPHYFERNGIKIALLGATRVMPEANWNAGAQQPGVAGAYDSTAIVKSIREARNQADLVIVVAHWGKERATALESHQTELSHAFIDAGADLVVGGHPHVLQGMEQYKGKWIAYSTGNFIFSKSTVPATWDTAIFQATCTRNGDCKMKLTPYRADLGQPIPLKDAEASKILQKVAALSPSNVSIGVDGTVSVQ
ncbi:CapA family protein [Paenibacillus polymyxa]|uniref:CapA family protein n=1 Tax=Paenibacillus polymyxa TaxID=1406 RepID=UPI0005CF87B5|nr:CapA family protein [Paenibacillus polymyxa]KAE8558732.1 poly-gamma-glutamate biosynthesis protein [Paenibacillus polymyxa]KJD41130.1 poly-gamma-glutamate biosynthesis protein [Paenibacillus polymyxa]MBE3647972.1 CapA family protein [Paenibacillus polymyxa]MCJ1222819.1 CapA family protein [Paenibacillus polymyxa]UNL96267.1 poly-gamma-glutamate biosynthesis protein [Paenibacillus polymyxa]